MLLNISNILQDEDFPICCKKILVVPTKYNLNSNQVEVCFNGNITLHRGFYILRGTVTALINCNCDICLLDIDIPLEFEITEEFSNNSTNNADVWKFSGKFIDITESLFVNLLLNIPMKFVCNDNCKGLCQICGANRNYDCCSCEI